MNALDVASRGRILDPMDRMSELIFGLVMVLTFTCTFSATESTRADVHQMMLAAIGCNVAWGLVDGVMFIAARLTDQLRTRRLLDAVRGATPEEATRLLEQAIPAEIFEHLTPRAVESLRTAIPPPAHKPVLRPRDWAGALGVCLISTIAVAPVLLPFVLLRDAEVAIRASNAVAIVLLVLVGQAWAGFVGISRWLAGILFALGGSVVVAITIALGG